MPGPWISFSPSPSPSSCQGCLPLTPLSCWVTRCFQTSHGLLAHLTLLTQGQAFSSSPHQDLTVLCYFPRCAPYSSLSDSPSVFLTSFLPSFLPLPSCMLPLFSFSSARKDLAHFQLLCYCRSISYWAMPSPECVVNNSISCFSPLFSFMCLAYFQTCWRVSRY